MWQSRINICGIPDLIQHNKNGFLVSPKNPDDLARSIQILLDNKNKRIQMGKEGKELSANYGAAKMVEKIESLYTRLLKEKNIFS